jgi:hypothetical protein
MHEECWVKAIRINHPLRHYNMLICASVTRGGEGERLAAHAAPRRLNGEEDGDRREGLDRTSEGDQPVRRAERSAKCATLTNDREISALLRFNDSAADEADERWCIWRSVNRHSERRVHH